MSTVDNVHVEPDKMQVTSIISPVDQLKQWANIMGVAEKKNRCLRACLYPTLAKQGRYSTYGHEVGILA